MATTVASNIDIVDVWNKYKADSTNVDLRNILIERYMPLVRFNGERLRAKLPEGVELDDLISAGIFGLMDAIDAFDMERGVKFETYTVYLEFEVPCSTNLELWTGFLALSEARQASSMKPPNFLKPSMGRAPTTHEISQYMGISIDELEKMKSDASAVGLVSLNKKWYETDSYKDVREIDVLEDKRSEDPTRRVNKSDLMRLVTKGLNRNERLIIILYYYEELTMKEIGATLDLSESRVSQMHTSIVQRLQEQLGRRRPEFGT